jgi:hypothetical protein
MDSCIDTDVFTIGGFPHSDICGSSVICTYPQLFAACHVLLRLSVPRHPPCALSSLTYVLSPSRLSNPKSNLLFTLSASSYIYLRYSIVNVHKHFNLLDQFYWSGGDNEIRTHDPLLARQVLSQLSYTPIFI